MSHDVIVIGAGAVGSAAAYHAAKDGQSVLLLEQFERDHQHGSSYGDSRIIRYAYTDAPYIAFANETYPLWETLEAESGEQLLIKTGGVDFGRPDQPDFAATRQALTDMNIPFEALTPSDVQRRFPQFHLTDDMIAIYQADAGLLRASACVLAHLKMAEQYGAIVQENCTVEQIIPHTDGVTVKSNQGEFRAKRLIIAAGAWATPLLNQLGLDLPLEISREQLAFFEAPSTYNAPQHPIYIGWGDEEI